MNLQQMKYVIYAAKYHSISKAAKELYMTQPNVSSAIKELEKELNVQIFERAKGGVSLTGEGVIFMQQIAPIMEQLGVLEDYYKKDSRVNEIFSVASQHCMVVSEAMDILLKEHISSEKYRLEILEVKTREVLSQVQSGASELGVLLKNKENKVLSGEIESNNLEFTLLQERKPIVYLGKHHPLAQKTLITKEDLENYPYVKYDQGKNSMQFYSEEVVEDHESDRTIIVTDNLTIFRVLQKMDAYTIGSGYRARGKAQQEDSQIVTIPYDSKEIIELGLLTNRDRQLSGVAQRYIEILKEILEKEQQEI